MTSSKQEERLEAEILIGEEVGKALVGEYAWHSVNAAIESFQKGDELRGLMLLRALMFSLAVATGREPPLFFGGAHHIFMSEND